MGLNRKATQDIALILKEAEKAISKLGKAAKNAPKATYSEKLVKSQMKRLNSAIKKANKNRSTLEKVSTSDVDRAQKIGGNVGSVEWFGSKGYDAKNGKVLADVSALKDQAASIIKDSSPEVNGFLNNILYTVGGGNKVWREMAATNPELMRSYVRLNNPLYKFAQESPNGLTSVMGTKNGWLNRFSNANEDIINAINATGKKRALIGLNGIMGVAGLGGLGYGLMQGHQEPEVVYIEKEPEEEPEDEYSDEYINSIGLVTSDGKYYDKKGNLINERGVNRHGVNERDSQHDIDNIENYFIANAKAFGLENPEQVAEIQKQLGVKVDGLFGPETERAYRRYLKSIGKFYNGGTLTNWINVQ